MMNIFFAPGVTGPVFLKIARGGQTLTISTHEMAPMCAFSVLQKRSKIAKMTQNDLLTLEMVFTEPLRRTKHSFSFLKFIIFVDLERKKRI